MADSESRAAQSATFLDDPGTLRHLERLRKLTNLLDQRLVDPALGFFLPGVGDALGSVLGLYGVYVALHLGISGVVVCRMLLNLALDAIFGAIPLIGVVPDLFFRAHARNLALIDARGQYGRATAGDWFIVALAVLLFLALLALPIVLAVWLANLLWAWFDGSTYVAYGLSQH